MPSKRNKPATKSDDPIPIELRFHYPVLDEDQYRAQVRSLQSFSLGRKPTHSNCIYVPGARWRYEIGFRWMPENQCWAVITGSIRHCRVNGEPLVSPPRLTHMPRRELKDGDFIEVYQDSETHFTLSFHHLERTDAATSSQPADAAAVTTFNGDFDGSMIF